MNALRFIRDLAYEVTMWLFWPLNRLLCTLRRNAVNADSVLHISAMVHIPYQTTRILRRHGLKADYLAIGTSPVWDKCDHNHRPHWLPFVRALQELRLFWSVVARYEIVHLHFAIPMSIVCGWELSFLKRMGRKIVVHYRGCEIRDADLNMKLHPKCSICQECDYDRVACELPAVRRRGRMAAKYGDTFLVTTPDMKDFVPDAEHMPFFAPEDLPEPPAREAWRPGLRPLRVVHVTNHPGLEGTRHIQEAIEKLKAKGHDIEFVFLKGVSHREVLEALARADLSIGKLKMGYYANAQIEAMALGVPVITWVRPEFMTEELGRSGFIFSTPEDLEGTLQHYLRDPDALAEKQRVARESILRLHDNDALAQRMVSFYNALRQREEKPAG